MTTTTNTPESLRSEAARQEQAAADSFDRCDTDGFLSQWAHGITARVLRQDAEILDNGGVWQFRAIFTLDGEFVPAKEIETQYGRRWMLLDSDGKRTGEFLPYAPKRRDTLAKKGYVEGYVLRPATAKVCGSGTGLAGCASAYVAVVPTDKPWEAPVEVLTVDRWSA